MIAYQKEKIDNAIVFFTKKHEEICKKPAFKTFIYKYLAFFDFKTLELTGQPALGLDYTALELGPVPEMFWDGVDNIKTVHFELQESSEYEGTKVFRAFSDPDLDYFSQDELDVMEDIVDKIMRPGLTAKEICDRTHKEIQAWKSAWNNRGAKRRVPMRMGDTFQNIYLKGEDELSIQEERFLVYDGLLRLEQDADWDCI